MAEEPHVVIFEPFVSDSKGGGGYYKESSGI